ncbi:MAG: hypothetical protein OH343_00965 [Candidatus Parvarchaeota archaeon]|nr:hypothetical protein [Candidatus Parvarchaeum tengchongense]
MPHNKKIANVRKKDERREAQAALDYLMSWGWVLIIIVLVLVILFSLGVFKAPSAPTIISGFKGITMQAAEANSTMMVVKITNNYNQFVNITGITVNVNGNTYTSYSCLDSIVSTGQSTLCRVPVVIPTTSYLSKIQISFTPYKSSIYEVSNGTVSSTLLSGAIPINNQLTYFVERGLPYGSTFTVNYNTSTNSTTVSSVNDNVSFNLPFGNYYFSVPTVTYQGCTSLPNPSAGYHSTGVGEIIAFTSNCTTTFSETGLPSGQSWQVTFNGTTKSNSTGSAIQIKTNNTANTQVYYTATAKSNNLACVSYKTPSIRLGESYTFSAWNCTTTFTETGLPTASGYNEWVAEFAGSKSSSTPTGSQISIYQTDISTVSQYAPSSNSYELSCLSDPSTLIFQGSSYTFNWWICTTTFSNTGVTNYPTSWNASFAGLNDNNVNVNANAVFKQNVTSVTVQSFSTVINQYDCHSSNSVYEGSSLTPPWNCVTTFSNTGVTNYPTSWNAEFDNVPEDSQSVSSNINVPTGTGSQVLGSFTYTTSINGYSCSSSSSTLAGSTVSNAPWNCVTTFSNTGVTNYPTSWNAEFDNVPEDSQPVSSNINVPTGTGSQVLGSFTYTTSINGYSCSSSSSTLAGSSISNVPWICQTTFDTNSVLSNDYPDGWLVSFDSNSTSGSTSGNLVVTSSKGPSILGSFSYSSSTGTYDCYSNNPPNELAGSTVSSIPWQCTTTFIGTGLPSSGYSSNSWSWVVSFNGESGGATGNLNVGLNTGLGVSNADLSISGSLTCSGSDGSVIAGNTGVATIFTCNELYLLGPNNITVESPNYGSYELADVISAGYPTCNSGNFGYVISGAANYNGVLNLIGRCKNSTSHYTTSANLNPYDNTISNIYTWNPQSGDDEITTVTALPNIYGTNEVAYGYAGDNSSGYYSGVILAPSVDTNGQIYQNLVTCFLYEIVGFSGTISYIPEGLCSGDSPNTITGFGTYDVGGNSFFNGFEGEYNIYSTGYSEFYNTPTTNNGQGAGTYIGMKGAYGVSVSESGWIYVPYQYRSNLDATQNNGFNVIQPSLSSHTYTSLPGATTSNNYVPVVVADNQYNDFFVIDGNNGYVYQYGPLNSASYSLENSYNLNDDTLDYGTLSPNGNYLYVASYGNDETYVFSTANIGRGPIATFKGPYGLPPLSEWPFNVHFEDQKGAANVGFPTNDIVSDIFQINSQSGFVS